jgi:hypothetical protein
MADSTPTVPVTAENLMVGDIIKLAEGGYFKVTTAPRLNRDQEEYAPPKITVWGTELNSDKTPVADNTQEIYHQNAVFQVLTPRPLAGT